uniref:Uncharacterized protein n=1 Tax=Oryza glumipatula TaxID=40148 RepID=A0A0E0AJ33_9ORYZ
MLGMVERCCTRPRDITFCWCLGWSRSCLPGSGKLGNVTPFAFLVVSLGLLCKWLPSGALR